MRVSDLVRHGAAMAHKGQESGNLLCLVIEFAVETRVTDDTVVPQGLQGARTDAEHTADILAIQPLCQMAVVTLACEKIHFPGKRCNTRKQRFKGFLFNNDYFHDTITL